MKLFGSGGENTTTFSTPDEDGQSYRASFEFYPFYEGEHYAIYKGIFNGRGRKRSHFCVVKALVDRPGFKADWNPAITVSDTACQLARQFNIHCCRGCKLINFPKPRLAAMAEVTVFNRFFRFFMRFKKRLQREEVVCIEDLVDGDLQNFSISPSADQSDPLMPPTHPNLAQAFSHFSWWFSRELVVGELKGTLTGKTYDLITPTIHSRSQTYGEMDRGWAGIQDFFSTHHCNSICRNWPGIELSLFPAIEAPLPLGSPPPPADLPQAWSTGCFLKKKSVQPFHPSHSFPSMAQPLISHDGKPNPVSPVTTPPYFKPSTDSGFVSAHTMYSNLGFIESVSRL